MDQSTIKGLAPYHGPLTDRHLWAINVRQVCTWPAGLPKLPSWWSTIGFERPGGKITSRAGGAAQCDCRNRARLRFAGALMSRYQADRTRTDLWPVAVCHSACRQIHHPHASGRSWTNPRRFRPTQTSLPWPFAEQGFARTAQQYDQLRRLAKRAWTVRTRRSPPRSGPAQP